MNPKIKLRALFVLLLVTVPGGFYIYSLTQPRILGPEDPRLNYVLPNQDKVDALVAEVDAYLKRFDDLEQIRPIQESDLNILEAALQTQKEVLRLTHNEDYNQVQKQRNIIKRYDDYKGQFVFERSVELEKEAAKLADDEELELAERKYLEALSLQDAISKRYSNSRYNNMPRQVRLERTVIELQTRPIHKEIQEEEALANQAMAAQDWEKAKVHLERALELVYLIARDFPASEYHDVGRIKRLEEGLPTIRSGRRNVEILEKVAEGREREREGQFRQAANLFQEAVDLQLKLNEVFRDSRYASTEKVEEYRALRQTAESAPLAQEIAELGEEIQARLKQRRTDQATRLIGEWSRKNDLLAETYPRSARIDPAVDGKITYMRIIAEADGKLDFIQSSVLEHLAAFDGRSPYMMMATEVPQELYQAIMGVNPSKRRGNRLPVESLTYADAQVFTKRLGWILGRDVTLPTKEIFEAAVGNLRFAPLLELSWNAANSEGQTREVGTTKPNGDGFKDVLGNVAEWVQPEPRTRDGYALVAGGSVKSLPEDLMEVPFIARPQEEADAFTGLRVLVRMEAGVSASD